MLGDAIPALDTTAFERHLNDSSYWSKVPTGVRSYNLRGPFEAREVAALPLGPC